MSFTLFISSWGNVEIKVPKFYSFLLLRFLKMSPTGSTNVRSKTLYVTQEKPFVITEKASTLHVNHWNRFFSAVSSFLPSFWFTLLLPDSLFLSFLPKQLLPFQNNFHCIVTFIMFTDGFADIAARLSAKTLTRLLVEAKLLENKISLEIRSNVFHGPMLAETSQRSF